MEIVGIALAMLLAGSIAGTLAGLLGVGGGIVLVPMLEVAFTALGVDESVRIHMAVATSLATIIPTSISSARAHHMRRAIDFDVIRFWSPFIFGGAIAGVVISSFISGQALAGVFALVGLAAAIKMIFRSADRPVTANVTRGIAGASLPVAIGAVSTLMGIGGGLISVPALSLMSKPVHVAIGTSALIGLFIAVPSAIGYAISGWGNAMLPIGSIGYVNLVGFAVIVPMTILFAPIGAKIAHSISQQHLSGIFGLFLFLAVIRMGFRAIG